MCHVGSLSLALWTSILVTFTVGAPNNCKLNLSYPDSEICGIQGTPTNKYSIHPFLLGEPLLVDSLEECALLCNRRARRTSYFKHDQYKHDQICVGIEFDTETSVCQLLNQPPTDEFVMNHPKDSHRFYTLGCFTCPDQCPQPFGTPLIDNRNFEGELLGPWISNYPKLAEQGRNSSKSWLCAPPDDAYYGCMLGQAFNMCRNSLYAIRFYYKEPNETSVSMSLRMSRLFDLYDDGDWYFEAALEPGNHSGTNDWKEATLIIPLYDVLVQDDGIKVYFSEQDNKHPQYGKGYLIDDVSVIRIDPNMRLKPSAKSVITNGGFETGKFSPWKIYDYNHTSQIYIVSPGITSKYGVMVERFLKNHFGRLQQRLRTILHANYLFSMDVRCFLSQHPLDYGVLEVELFSGGRRVEYIFYVETSDVYTFSVPFVAYDTTTIVNITTRFQRYILDNIHLTELARPIF